MGPPNEDSQHMRVSDLIDSQTQTWNTRKIDEFLQRIHIGNVDWNAQIWKTKAAPKIKLFFWKAIHGALPVGEQLEVRNVVPDPKYCRCNETE